MEVVKSREKWGNLLDYTYDLRPGTIICMIEPMQEIKTQH